MYAVNDSTHRKGSALTSCVTTGSKDKSIVSSVNKESRTQSPPEGLIRDNDVAVFKHNKC